MNLRAARETHGMPAGCRRPTEAWRDSPTFQGDDPTSARHATQHHRYQPKRT
jgi:hypothetical protein